MEPTVPKRARRAAPKDAAATARPLTEQIARESEAMARYALASGKAVPAAAIDVAERAGAALRGAGPWPPLPRLTRAHEVLAALVAPATPRTIVLLSQRPRTGVLAALGPVRLVRHMLVAAVVLIVAFVLLAMSPDVNHGSGDIFESSGYDVLVNLLFFLVLGGIGAAFAQLFNAYRYIAAGTYDPKYEASYWVRFILGLIAGVVLPALIPIGEDGNQFTKPLLALLGGFSAAVLYRILERLVAALESVVSGDPRVAAAAEADSAAARAAQALEQERLQLLGDLTRLQEQVRSGAAADDVAAGIDRLLGGLVPAAPTSLDGDGLSEEEEQPAPEAAETDEDASTPPQPVS